MGSKLSIDVTAKTTQATQNIQNISKKIDELASRKNSITGLSVSIAAIGEAARKVKNILLAVTREVNECIDAYSTQILGEKRLDVILKNVSTDAKLTTKSLKDYASALQQVTRFGDDAILSAEQILAETGKLNKDGLMRATALSLDLAEAMGTDAASAAQTLALALQDPETGLRRLRMAHITFSDAQKETIKLLIEEGKELEAQDIILNQVSKTYGGLAEEIGKVDVSKIDKIKNLLGDIKEDLGYRLLNSIAPELEKIYGWLLKIKEWSDPQVHVGDVDIPEEFNRDVGFFGKYWSDQISGKRDFLTPNTTNNNVYNRLLSDLYAEIEKSKISWSDLDKVLADFKSDLDSLAGDTKASLADGTTYKQAYERYLGLHALIQDAKQTGKYGVANKKDAVNEAVDYGYDFKILKPTLIPAVDVTNRELPGASLSSDNVSFNNLEDSVGILEDESLGKKFNEWIDQVWNKRISNVVSYAAKAINSISGLVNQLYSNEISALDRQLSEMESKWDKYFENLEKKHAREKAGLDGMYESGQMSAEEYEAKLAELDDARVKAEEDKQAELEKTQKRKAELEKRQFDANKANQIAQVTISGAQAIAGIWASSGAYGLAGPAIAATLTALSAASIGAQIATIASQQYVPALAEGGIVSKPTLALIGEAGPEAVVPLKKGGVAGMTVVVQVENVYTSDDLSEAVFEGISKLQKTGALPAWS